MRRQYSTAPAGRELEHALADGGDRDFGKEDDREDGDEDGGDGAPLEDVDRGVQHEPDAARADQPEHGAARRLLKSFASRTCPRPRPAHRAPAILA
jgi:hypothetical protein